LSAKRLSGDGQMKCACGPAWRVGFTLEPGVLDRCRRFAQAAIGMNGQRGDAAGVVVRDEEAPASNVHGEMAWSDAAGSLPVQRSEFASAYIKRERTHCAGIGHFIDSVEVTPAGMDGKKGWVLGLGGEFRRAQSAGRRVKSGNVNSLALRAGIGAEINQRLADGIVHSESTNTATMARTRRLEFMRGE